MRRYQGGEIDTLVERMSVLEATDLDNLNGQIKELDEELKKALWEDQDKAQTKLKRTIQNSVRN